LSYLVLARKWRPKQFDDVVGQRAITRTLQNAILSGRIAHAYLFSGQRGVGKTTTARILAKALNCQEGPIPKPCDVCTLCKEINRGSSIDVIEIDGASNNSVDDIRDLREKVHYIPAQARYKVYIIDEVHMLSKPAFNALLKTLEEPPEHIVFILATTEAHKIPITIRSRCQRYDFRRVSPQDIYTYLDKLIEEEGGLKGEKEAALHLIAKAADGSLRDALSLIDQVISFSNEGITLQQVLDLVSLVDYHAIGELLRAVVEGKTKEALICIEKITERGHDLKHYVEQVLHYIRDIIIFKMSENDNPGLDLSEEEIKEISKIAQAASQEDLLRYFDILSRSVEKMRFSSQPRLILEMALIRMAELPKLESLENLIKRLDLYEKVKAESAGPKGTEDNKESKKIKEIPSIFQEPPPSRIKSEAVTFPERDEILKQNPVPEPEPEDNHARLVSGQKTFDWTEIIQEVKKEGMAFGSVLEHLKVTHQEGTSTLELALEEDNPFYLKLIEDKKNKAIMSAAIAKVTGNNLKIKWVLQGNQDFGKKSRTKEEEKDEVSAPGTSLERSLDLINREPMIQKAMDIFSAQIVETYHAEDGTDNQSVGERSLTHEGI
jgi:DNA polymerase-3 subunit gamma/tau